MKNLVLVVLLLIGILTAAVIFGLLTGTWMPTAIVVVALAVTSPLWGGFILKALAEKPIIVTTVPVGEGTFLVRGENAQDFFVGNRDLICDSTWNITPGKNDKTSPRMSPFARSINKALPGNYYFLGNPFLNDIHPYTFRWEETRDAPVDPDEEGLVQQVQLRSGKWAVAFEKEVTTVFLKTVFYYLRVAGVESSEGTTVDIDLEVPIQPINPLQMIFNTYKWLNGIFEMIQGAFRDWAAIHTVDDIIKANMAEVFREIMNGPGGLTYGDPTDGKTPLTLRQEIAVRFGAAIVGVPIADVIPPKEYTEATAAQAAAGHQAKTIAALAAAEAGRITTEAAAFQTGGDAAAMHETLVTVQKLAASGNLVFYDGRQGFPPPNVLFNSGKGVGKTQPPTVSVPPASSTPEK